MNKLKLSTLFLVMTGIFLSCNGHRNDRKEKINGKAKTLVLYYSQTGTTKKVAEEIQKQLGADIDSIVPVDSYGYDFDSTIQRWNKEKEDSIRVAIKPLATNINDYDTIFIGFPIWGGTYAPPMATWLEDNNLEGKTVITFATFGSGGIENATSNLKSKKPAANVVEGYGVRNARIQKAPVEINRWLIENGYKSGKVTEHPNYGEVKPLTDEETEIFNQACGDYKFPMGTPISVALRSYNDTIDYRYVILSKTPEGKEINSTVYVVVVPNEKPDFTRVVR